jgi:acyl carrier protein
MDTIDLQQSSSPQSECSQATRGDVLPSKGGIPTKADAIDVSVVKDTSAVQLVLGACASALLNTEVPANAPLMSVGLDSIATVEFTNAISDELETSVSAMVLFDHPTLDSIASYLAAELELGAATVVRTAPAILGSSFLGSPVNHQILLYIVSACFMVTGATSSEAAL